MMEKQEVGAQEQKPDKGTDAEILKGDSVTIQFNDARYTWYEKDFPRRLLREAAADCFEIRSLLETTLDVTKLAEVNQGTRSVNEVSSREVAATLRAANKMLDFFFKWHPGMAADKQQLEDFEDHAEICRQYFKVDAMLLRPFSDKPDAGKGDGNDATRTAKAASTN